MIFLADMLLVAGCFSVALHGVILSRRLKRLNSLDGGLGGAIAVMSAQVDDMTKVLKAAQVAAAASENSLATLTGRADDVARRLELMLAALHDVAPDARPDAAVLPLVLGAEVCAGGGKSLRSRAVHRSCRAGVHPEAAQ